MKLSELKGIGPKTEALFTKLGVNNANSLLRYYPVHYDEYTKPETISAARSGRKFAVLAYPAGNITVYETGRMKVFSVEIRDATGRMRVSWFNAPYICSVVKRGKP